MGMFHQQAPWGAQLFSCDPGVGKFSHPDQYCITRPLLISPLTITTPVATRHGPTSKLQAACQTPQMQPELKLTRQQNSPTRRSPEMKILIYCLVVARRHRSRRDGGPPPDSDSRGARGSHAHISYIPYPPSSSSLARSGVSACGHYDAI